MKQIPLYLVALSCLFCHKKPDAIQNAALEEKYVSVKDGLNVRETPELNGKRITTLANRTKVTILETKPETFKVGDVSGSWTKVSAGKIQGWAFGGFLSVAEPPGDPDSNDCANAKRDAENEWKECIAKAAREQRCPPNGECEPSWYACMSLESSIETTVKKACGDKEPISPLMQQR